MDGNVPEMTITREETYGKIVYIHEIKNCKSAVICETIRTNTFDIRETHQGKLFVMANWR